MRQFSRSNVESKTPLLLGSWIMALAKIPSCMYMVHGFLLHPVREWRGACHTYMPAYEAQTQAALGFLLLALPRAFFGVLLEAGAWPPSLGKEPLDFICLQQMLVAKVGLPITRVILS